MPDPKIYLWSTAVALIAGMLGTFTIHRILAGRNPKGRQSSGQIAAVVGLALGIAFGFFALRLRVAWPPANALDRFLTIVFPTAVVVELIAATVRLRWQVLLRCALYANCGWILLYGSSYLRTDQNFWQLIAYLLVPAALLICAAVLMTRLGERTCDVSIPIGVAMATCCAGLLVMMYGYLKGGSAAFPVAGALVGMAGMSKRLQLVEVSSAVLLGIVGLFGILFIGRFFGGLPAWTAVVVFLSPLSAWLCEIPLLRRRKDWQRFVIRLIFVAIPLVVVLVLAWIEFQREMGPLI